MLMYFAAIDGDPTVLALIAIVGTVITALFKLLGDNTKAQANLGVAIKSLTDETAKGNREAKQRNGHLGEQNIQITEMIASMGQNINDKADRNFKAFQNIQTQHVVKQTIDNAVVNDEIVKHKEDK